MHSLFLLDLLPILPLSLALATPKRTSSNCGLPGSMALDATTLPNNINASRVRTCIEHPLYLAEDVTSNSDTPPPHRTLNAQKRGPPHTDQLYGCARGYCWQVCGDNRPNSVQWCWLAADEGWGDWMKCTADWQCVEKFNPDPFLKGAKCGQAKTIKCKACFCSY